MHHPDQNLEYEIFTFGQFLDLAEKFALFYQSRGLQSRAPIVLILPQGIPLMAGFVGAMMVGAIPTILAYPNFKVDAEKYQRGLSGVTSNIGADMIVVDEAFPARFQNYISQDRNTSIVQLVEQICDQTSEMSVHADPRPGDVAFLQHSAGTTGLQKGVALPHRTVLNQLEHQVTALQVRPDDRIVSWLPLYHDMGLIACFVLPLVCHLRIVMQSPADWVLRPGSFLHLATKFKCTLSWLPNFAFQFMARRVPVEERHELDLSSLRGVINTSEPIRAGSMEEFYSAYSPFGLSRAALQTSYGMAENTFAVTQSPVDGFSRPRTIWIERNLLWKKGRVELVSDDHPAALSFVSCGRCMDSNIIRVIADDGTDLEEGWLGEILVRSDCQFDGYHNRPDLTEKVLRDDWYWTGDAGFVMDSEVYVIGRRDDAIIIGGRNLYPQDIEEIAYAHPCIHDGRSVAFGLDNPDLGTKDLVVVAEVNDENDLGQRRQIVAEIREQILAEIGVSPRTIYLVSPKWVVKSTAGKSARSTNLAKFLLENPEFAQTDTRSLQE